MALNDRFARLTAALAHCTKPADRKLPADLKELAALRDHATATVQTAMAGFATSRDPAGYALRLAAATDTTDFNALVDQISGEWTRRAVLREAGAGGLVDHLQRNLEKRIDELMPAIVAGRLVPVFNSAVAKLTAAAKELPPGDAALDAQAILEANQGDAYRMAFDALKIVDAMREVWPPTLLASNNVAIGLLRVLPILAIDKTTEPLKVNWQGHPLPDADQHRATASIHKLIGHITARNYGEHTPWDETRTAFELARGEWPGLTLGLATDRAELTARARLVEKAHTTVAGGRSAPLDPAVSTAAHTCTQPPRGAPLPTRR